MNRLREYLWPMRWPTVLALLAANLIRYVPPDDRNAYTLLALGLLTISTLRLFFIDHERREDEKARAREERFRLADRGVEAMERTLKRADAELVKRQDKLEDRIRLIDGEGGRLDVLEAKFQEMDRSLSPLARAARAGGHNE